MGQKALNKRHEESQQKMNTLKFQLDESKTELDTCLKDMENSIHQDSFEQMIKLVEDQNEAFRQENADLRNEIKFLNKKRATLESEYKEIEKEKNDAIAEVTKCKELEKKSNEETQIVIKKLHEKSEQEALKCQENRKKTEQRVRNG